MDYIWVLLIQGLLIVSLICIKIYILSKPSKSQSAENFGDELNILLDDLSDIDSDLFYLESQMPELIQVYLIGVY